MVKTECTPRYSIEDMDESMVIETCESLINQLLRQVFKKYGVLPDSIEFCAGAKNGLKTIHFKATFTING